MRKVLWFTVNVVTIIIAWNLGLQLISGANTFANIAGILVIVVVIYLIAAWCNNKLLKIKKNEK
jgi:hypothetical protein